MSPMEYVTIFDIRQSGFSHWWALGLIPIACGLIMLFLRARSRSLVGRVLPFVSIVFGLFWTLATLASTAIHHFGLASDLRNGRCEVVEGVVTQFDPMPYQGHKYESFVVAGHRFQYSDYIITGGFNRSRSHGGPIRDGLSVRIRYRGDDIAQLEIAKVPN